MPNKGYKQTEEHKRKCSVNLTGRKFFVGHNIWNHPNAIRTQFKSGEEHSKYWLGKKRPNLWNGKRKDLIGRHLSPNSEFKKGKHYSIETEFNKENRQNFVCPKQDTKIELKIQKILTRLGIEFYTHVFMNKIKYAYQCDIFIPSMNLVIECDGDYWHGNLERFQHNKLPLSIRVHRILDYERTNQLEETGYKVIRLSEGEIKRINSDKLQERLKVIKL